LKGYVRLSEEELKKEKNFLQEKELKLLGSSAGNRCFVIGCNKLFMQLSGLSDTLFVLRGSVLHGRPRAGCRYSVFDLAEKHHGKVRVGVDSDGIGYNEVSATNLDFQIVFKEESQAEDFETAVKKIPLVYRKRPFASEEVPDISVTLEKLEVIKCTTELVRILSEQYKKSTGTDVSPDFDVYSYVSTVVCVELNDETRLRLVDREDSIELFRQKPEECHIISRKVKAYSRDPNNIVYMSRSLHQQYDALDSTEGVAQFYLQYVRHDTVGHQGIVNKKTCNVFTTVVRVVFIDAVAKSALSPKFKMFTDVDLTRIEITLDFTDPLLFNVLASERMDTTISSWNSFRGVDSDD